MYLTPVHNALYFRAKITEENKDKKDQKVSKSDVAVATGATGAASTKLLSKGRTLKQVSATTKEVQQTVEFASTTTTKAKSLFGQFLQNCEHYKQSIINYGKRLSDSNLLKPILTSKAYRGAAGFVGGAAAGLVTISGVGDMMNTFARKADELSK